MNKQATETDFAATIDMPAGAAPPPDSGSLAVTTFGGVITAQRVAVPRNHNRIKQTLAALCAMSGEQYVYSWNVKDRRNRREQTIEGPTIKLANDLAREYGNCVVDVRALDEAGGHTMFYARFTDLETGFAMVRAFRQRRGQDMGMRNQGRADDIVFQIGQSKAIRNVVVNALSTYVDYMMEESKNNLLGKIENNRDKAEAFVDKVATQYVIAMERVEAVVGRVRKKWTVRDLARVYSEMRGIAEGMSHPDDIYPSAEDAKVVMDQKTKLDDIAGEEGKGEGQEGAGAADPKPKPKAAAKKATPKKPAAKPAAAGNTEPQAAADPTPHDPETGEIIDETPPDNEAERLGLDDPPADAGPLPFGAEE